MATEIKPLQINILKQWAKQTRSSFKSIESLDEKIAKLEEQKAVHNKAIKAYDSLIEATFGEQFKGLSLNDLVVFTKIGGASIPQLNPKYIHTEVVEKVRADGMITKAYKYTTVDAEDTTSKEEVAETKEENVQEAVPQEAPMQEEVPTVASEPQTEMQPEEQDPFASSLDEVLL